MDFPHGGLRRKAHTVPVSSEWCLIYFTRIGENAEDDENDDNSIPESRKELFDILPQNESLSPSLLYWAEAEADGAPNQFLFSGI